MYKIMAVKVDPRIKNAPEVQEVLTKYGCLIHTRIGLHEASKTECSNSGLILLNLLDDDNEVKKLQVDLNSIDGATAKILEI